MKTKLTIAFVCAACALAGACVDITPIELGDATVEPADARDGAVDATIDDADALVGDAMLNGDTAIGDSAEDAYGPCIACLELADDASPAGCGTELSACFADPECEQTIDCALADHCLAFTAFNDIITCGVPCAEEAGVNSQTSPQALEIVQVVLCAQTSKCVSLCQ